MYILHPSETKTTLPPPNVAATAELLTVVVPRWCRFLKSVQRFTLAIAVNTILLSVSNLPYYSRSYYAKEKCFPGEEKYYWRSDSPQSTSHVSTGAFRMWTAVLKTLGITGETLRKMRFNFHTLPFNETIRKREGKRNCTKKGLFEESSKKLILEQSSSNSETPCGGAIIWRTLSAIFSSNRLLPRQQTSNTRVTPMLWPLVKLTADCIKSCPWFYAVLSATSLTLHQLMSSSFIHEAEILRALAIDRFHKELHACAALLATMVNYYSPEAFTASGFYMMAKVQKR